MDKQSLFRWWFYARQGYQTYFAFAFIGINTLTVTYYLAIERAPFLQAIFPTFSIYVAIVLVIGMPVLVLTGFFHYKKVPAYKSEAEVNIENNPYTYKIPPGWMLYVGMPFNLLVTKLLVKLSNNEKFSEPDRTEISKLQKNIERLLQGGYVGDKNRTLAFDLDKKD